MNATVRASAANLLALIAISTAACSVSTQTEAVVVGPAPDQPPLISEPGSVPQPPADDEDPVIEETPVDDPIEGR